MSSTSFRGWPLAAPEQAAVDDDKPDGDHRHTGNSATAMRAKKNEPPQIVPSAASIAQDFASMEGVALVVIIVPGKLH